jgi:hypothetical protein
VGQRAWREKMKVREVEKVGVRKKGHRAEGVAQGIR